MPTEPFRFVHAADFHLEKPIGGLSEVPEHLRDMLIDGAYRAAERVFDTVLAEEAEFLVLSGDILHYQLTGPRGPLFLAEQFERVAQRGIAVYWAGGRVDPPEAWPHEIKLPNTVHLFPSGRPEQVVHQRDMVPLARLLGASRVRGRAIRPAEFDPDPAGLYTIAVVHGRAEAESLRSRAIHYWALGGNHARTTLYSAPHVAHYPGTPQSRGPAQTGPHGCTLVSVDQQQQARTTLVPTDSIRWHSERLVVDESTSRAQFEACLRQRLGALTETAGTDMLICWVVAGTGPLLAALRRGNLAAELLAMLRSEAGQARPSAWSVSIGVEPPAVLPAECYEQQTILGDYLRELRHYQMNPDEPLELENYLSPQHAAGTLGPLVAVSDAAMRERLLREAAVLGVDLLTGEGPGP